MNKKDARKVLVMVGILGILWLMFFAIGVGAPTLLSVVVASIATTVMAFILIGCALAGEWL
jgi:type IV secretory pathway VirB6-like protein